MEGGSDPSSRTLEVANLLAGALARTDSIFGMYTGPGVSVA